MLRQKGNDVIVERAFGRANPMADPKNEACGLTDELREIAGDDVVDAMGLRACTKVTETTTATATPTTTQTTTVMTTVTTTATQTTPTTTTTTVKPTTTLTTTTATATDTGTAGGGEESRGNVFWWRGWREGWALLGGWGWLMG